MKLRSVYDIIFKTKDKHQGVSFVFRKDVPEVVDRGVIYIIGERPYFWAITFCCPCHCGEIITLNLLKDANPKWRFFIKWGKVTLYPSVWRRVGCKSHFRIIKNKVVWCYL